MKLRSLGVYARHCPIVRFVRRTPLVRDFLAPAAVAALLMAALLLRIAAAYGAL
jgi:hypothetical protein